MILLKDLLSEGIKSDGPLNDVPEAKSLYHYLVGTDFASDAFSTEEILAILSSPNIDVNLDDDNTIERINDGRFKAVYLSGIKKYPSKYLNKGIYYGVEFESESQTGLLSPNSAIIVGENGAGKTSFFTALEIVGKNDTDIAKIYGVGATDYVKNLSEQSVSAQIKVNTLSGLFASNLSENIKPKVQRAFYGSEWDIRQLEKTTDIGRYVFSEIGFESARTFISLLKTTINEISQIIPTIKVAQDNLSVLNDKLSINRLILSTDDDKLDALIKWFENEKLPFCPEIMDGVNVLHDALSIIDAYSTTIRYMAAYTNSYCGDHYIENKYIPLFDKINELQSALYDHFSSPTYEKSNQIKTYVENLRDLVVQGNEMRKEIANRIKDSLSKFNHNKFLVLRELEDIQKEISIQKKTIEKYLFFVKDAENYYRLLEPLTKIHDFLKEGFDAFVAEQMNHVTRPVFISMMDEYLKDDNAAIGLAYDSQTMLIRCNLTVEMNGETILTEPRKYFNTVRFKLFVLALKIACACTAKVVHRQNWPIVIDDIFNASDFDHRMGMRKFIKTLVDTYNRNEYLQDYAFQLIYFTQDDLIGTSLFKGLRDSGKPTKLMRLQDYRGYDSTEIKTQSLDFGGPIDILNIADTIDYCPK